MGWFDFLTKRKGREHNQATPNNPTTGEGSDQDKKLFAQLVLNMVKKTNPDLSVRYDASNFALKITNAPDAEKSEESEESQEGGTQVAWLENVYADYHNTSYAKDRRATLKHFVQSIVVIGSMEADGASATSFEQVRSQLMPLVRCAFDETHMRHQIYFDKDDDLHSQNMLSIAQKRISSSIAIQLGLDTEHSIARVTADDLKGWGVDFDEALEIAINNLRQISAKPLWRNMQNGVYVAYWDDSYDSSRLLLPDSILELSVQGDPIALVPSRQMLIVAGADDAEAVQAAAELAASVYQEDTRLISTEALRLNPQTKAWQPYQIAGELGQQLWLEHAQQLKTAYDAQRELLNTQAENEEIELDAYVADQMCYQKKDGTVFSVCAWADQVSVLLPVCDYIMLNRTEPDDITNVIDEVTLTWDTAVELLADCLEQNNTFQPVLYQSKHFPDDKLFATLKEHAATI